MVEKEYNRQYKKWKVGDTFAYKIKNDERYKGRYIILIRYENPEWEPVNNNYSFRAKLTIDGALPETKEELEKLEYIEPRVTHYSNRFLPFSGLIPDEELIKERSKVKFYPDEYGLLDVYTFDIYFSRKYLNILNEFIYLGNYNLKNPEKEYIPFDRNNAGYYLIERIENILEDYERYNLKKSPLYVDENKKSIEEITTYVPPNPEEVRKWCKKMGFDFSKEKRKKDSLTYVGGEDEDPYEDKQ